MILRSSRTAEYSFSQERLLKNAEFDQRREGRYHERKINISEKHQLISFLSWMSTEYLYNKNY